MRCEECIAMEKVDDVLISIYLFILPIELFVIESGSWACTNALLRSPQSLSQSKSKSHSNIKTLKIQYIC